MKTLAELRTEVELGFTVYRIDDERPGKVYRCWHNFWWESPAQYTRSYDSFDELWAETEGAGKPIWSTLRGNVTAWEGVQA